MQGHAAEALGQLAIGSQHNKDIIKAMGAVPALVTLSRSSQADVQHAALNALRLLVSWKMQFLRSLATHELLKLPVTFFETA